MKNFWFKRSLILLSLVFTTMNTSTALASINCCEDVIIDKVVASYTSDTTFEIYIKAEENMEFIQTASPVVYHKFMKDRNHYIPATITIHDDDGTGTDEFKIVVSGLDFGSRIFFTWVDLKRMGTEVFKNWDYARNQFRRLNFKRSQDFRNGTAGTDNTGWYKLDAAIDAEEAGWRWDKQKIITTNAHNAASLAKRFSLDTVDYDTSIEKKWDDLKTLKTKIVLHKRQINKLVYPNVKNSHQAVINYHNRKNDGHKASALAVQKKLEGFWQKQKVKVLSAYTAATRLKEEMEENKGASAALEASVAKYLKELDTLEKLQYTQEEKDFVIQHKIKYRILKQALDKGKAVDSEARNSIIAITTISSSEGVSQVVEFTPKLVDEWKVYTIEINNMHHSVVVNPEMSIKDIVEALHLQMLGSPIVTCTDANIKVICTAKIHDKGFQYSALVVGTTQEKAEADKAAFNAITVKGVKSGSNVHYVKSFTPALADSYKTYTLSIDEEEYSMPVNPKTTGQQIVEEWAGQLIVNTTVTCAEDNITLTCTGNIMGEKFTAAVSVLDREPSMSEKATRVWEIQRTKVSNLLVVAINLKAILTSAMAEDGAFPSKLEALTSAKQANESLREQILALEAVKRSESDTDELEYFNSEYQKLKRGTEAFEQEYNTSLEAKQAEEAEAAWALQKLETSQALTLASNAQVSATNVMRGNDTLEVKLLSIEEAKRLNGNFYVEIQELSSVKRSDADSAIISTFNQKHQVFSLANTALKEEYIAAVEAKRVKDLKDEEKRVFDNATLTGHWKSPAIKGLNYVTETHLAGVTDELGAFKCQPNEAVTFSIESLVLTTVKCKAILETKNTNNISLDTNSIEGFKDWKDEEGKQILLTKIFFGLFGESIKTAFSQQDDSLKYITAELTEAQKVNTLNQSLDANDVNLLVQNILGVTEAVVLPTTAEAQNMVASGWQVNKVFGTNSDGGTTTPSTGEEKKSSGGGCVYNPKSKSSSDIGVVLLLVLSIYYLVRRKRLNLK